MARAAWFMLLVFGCAETTGSVEQPVTAAEREPEPALAAEYVPPSDWPAGCPLPANAESEPAYRHSCERRAEERQRLQFAAEQPDSKLTGVDWLPFAREHCFPKRCPPDRVGGYGETPAHQPITYLPDSIVTQVLTEKCAATPVMK